MPKIINKRYGEFKKKGSIKLFNIDELNKGLIKAGQSKYSNMGKAFLILLYYTGARPIELLQLKPEHFEKKSTYLTIQIPTAKKGVPRVISIPFVRKHIKKLYKYVQGVYKEVYIFYDLISKRIRYYKTKFGDIKKYIIITDKIYYHIKKWINVPPYFLRHSRMSALSQNGADLIELQHFKGSKRTDSVLPYLHMSSKISQKIGRKLK